MLTHLVLLLLLLLQRLFGFFLHLRYGCQEVDAVQCGLECVHEALLDIRPHSCHGLLQFQVHPLAALVVGNQHRSYPVHVGIDQSFDSIGHRIEGMEYVVETGTRRQTEVQSELIDAPDGHEHADGRSQSKELLGMEDQLGVVDDRLASAGRTHRIANLLGQQIVVRQLYLLGLEGQLIRILLNELIFVLKFRIDLKVSCSPCSPPRSP